MSSCEIRESKGNVLRELLQKFEKSDDITTPPKFPIQKTVTQLPVSKQKGLMMLIYIFMKLQIF